MRYLAAPVLTFGSLFAGLGGLEHGLMAAFNERGFATRVAWQVEQAEFPRRVLGARYPEANRSVTDVRKAGAATLIPVDLICFGFPCPDISYNGRGAGLAGDRSGLWSEGRECVRDLQPRFVVVENVSALLGRGMGDVLGDLASLGYDARWDCVSAQSVGFPYERDRVFITAWREWSPLVRASALPLCECCDDPWCERCGVHYGECQCPGPHSDGEGWSIVEEPWGIVAYPDVERMEGRWADWFKVLCPYARARLLGGEGASRRGNDRETLARLVRRVDGIPGGVELSRRRPNGLGHERAEWEPERLIPSKVDDWQTWKDRIMAIGNAVNPAVGQEVGRRLIEEGLLS